MHIQGFCLALIGLALMAGSVCFSATQSPAPPVYRFEYESHTTQSGALYRSSGFATNNDDNVDAVLVGSGGRVWVGTVAGLAVYDGRRWDSRTFPVVGVSPTVRKALGLLQMSHSGPNHIVEGPPGTVWLAGTCGIWRYRDGRYEAITSDSVGRILGVAVGREGELWVLSKEKVQTYGDGTWRTRLCPYIGRPKSIEAPGLVGIGIGTNGNVWIGGTVYGEPAQPWEHEGPVWVVDQGREQRNGGPPMAPVFEFDGKAWRAFGAPHGLDVKWAVPELDEQSRMTVRTPRGRFIREGDSWKALKGVGGFAGKRWVLQGRKRGLIKRGAELLYRDGERLLEVRPADARTGAVLDLGAESLPLLVIAEDPTRECVWLGTSHGLYRIWREKAQP